MFNRRKKSIKLQTFNFRPLIFEGCFTSRYPDFFNPTIINKLLSEVLTSSTCSLCISILCISEKIIVSHVIIGTMYGTGLLLVSSLIINGYHNYLVYQLCKYEDAYFVLFTSIVYVARRCEWI